MSSNDFYKRKSVIQGHSFSFPLIKPYHAIENRIIKKWDIDVYNNNPFKHNNALQIKLIHVDSLNIIDSIIIAKCSGNDCSYGGEKVGEIYHIIIPPKKIEKTLFSYQEFYDFFRTVEKQKPPVFYRADEINENWQNKNTLPWGKIDTAFERKTD